MFIKSLIAITLATIMSCATAAPNLRYHFEWKETVKGQAKRMNQFDMTTAGHTVEQYSSTKSFPYHSGCVEGANTPIISAIEVGPHMRLIAMGVEPGNKIMTSLDYQLTDVTDTHKPLKGCEMDFLNVYTLKGKLQLLSVLDEPTTVIRSIEGEREISLIMTVTKSDN